MDKQLTGPTQPPIKFDDKHDPETMAALNLQETLCLITDRDRMPPKK